MTDTPGFTYEVTTDVGKVRLLLNDVDRDTAVFNDLEIQAFLDLEGGSVKRARGARPRLRPTVQATGPTPSSSTTSTSCFAIMPGASVRPISTAAPIVGCPAKGNSRVGVKMRSRAVFTGSRGGSTKTVSERLNSRAIACIRSSSSPSQSRTTASGLPASGSSVKTSSAA